MDVSWRRRYPGRVSAVRLFLVFLRAGNGGRSLLPSCGNFGFFSSALSGLVWFGFWVLLSRVFPAPSVSPGSVERFRNDQRQHELMSDRDPSSGGTGCLILVARLSEQEVDRDRFPSTHDPSIRLGET